ncbi:hypothetical protein GCM10010306_096840 [Streptomyces umbrinus]|nr:hypothetical protein GCM10010306_096840 [Streptomyces umbrinus]
MRRSSHEARLYIARLGVSSARATVLQQGEGLSVAQVAEKVAEAERRERETRQQLDSPAANRGPYDGDPQDLAER